MKSDINGCSTTKPGEEQYEYFSSDGRDFVQYDYRTTDGVLFSCVAPTVGAARDRRDAWLETKLDNDLTKPRLDKEKGDE